MSPVSSPASMGAVVIEGPKACGKTRTAEENAASAVHLDTNPCALEAIAIDPGLILDGPTPRLIDEWQLASTAVWNHVRSEVDRRGRPRQFILTGSSVPDDDVRRHSGAGRFARLTMRPMSLYESGDSTGEISLASLLAGDPQRAADPGLSVRRIAELIVRGGWPLQLELDSAAALQAGDDYLTKICEVDPPRLEGAHPGPRRDPQRLRRLLVAVARNVATEAGPSRLAADADPETSVVQGPSRASGTTPMPSARRYAVGPVFATMASISSSPSWSRSHNRLAHAAPADRDTGLITCPTTAALDPA